MRQLFTVTLFCSAVFLTSDLAAQIKTIPDLKDSLLKTIELRKEKKFSKLSTKKYLVDFKNLEEESKTMRTLCSLYKLVVQIPNPSLGEGFDRHIEQIEKQVNSYKDIKQYLLLNNKPAGYFLKELNLMQIIYHDYQGDEYSVKDKEEIITIIKSLKKDSSTKIPSQVTQSLLETLAQGQKSSKDQALQMYLENNESKLPVHFKIRLGFDGQKYPDKLYKLLSDKKKKDDEVSGSGKLLLWSVLGVVSLVLGFAFWKGYFKSISKWLVGFKKYFIFKKTDSNKISDDSKEEEEKTAITQDKPVQLPTTVEHLEQKWAQAWKKELGTLTAQHQALQRQVSSLQTKVTQLEAEQSSSSNQAIVSQAKASNTAAQIQVVQVLYAEPSDYQVFHKASDYKNNKVFFKLNVLEDKTANFEFLIEQSQYAIKVASDVLEDACEYANSLYRDEGQMAPKTQVRTLKAGKAIKQASSWKITQKALIEFYD